MFVFPFRGRPAVEAFQPSYARWEQSWRARVYASIGSIKEELMKATVKKGSKNRMKSAKEIVRDAKKAGGKLKKKVMGK